MKRLWSDSYEPYKFHLPTFRQETKGQLSKTIGSEEIKRQEDLMAGIPVSIVLS